MRPTAANAALRPRQIAARSSADPAMCSRVQPWRSQISLTWSNCGVALRGGAVQLDDQRGGHADRVAGVHGLLGGLDRERVHHLDGGGHDPRADDVADDVARRPRSTGSRPAASAPTPGCAAAAR